MFEFPPIPTWDGLHPIIVHFPIALLITTPVMIVAALAWKRHRFGLNTAALLLMILGTSAAFIAVSTGEAAGELAVRSPSVSEALEHHEELGELTRNLFVGLTVAFGVMLGAGWVLRTKLKRAYILLATVAYLAAYGAGSIVLMNTGHAGGRLVHEFDVRAIMPADTAADHDD